MIGLSLKYYFRNGFFLRFSPFIIPAFYTLNNKVGILIYLLIFILFEKNFCELYNEKYFWDNRINILTNVRLNKLMLSVNITNFLSVLFWFCVSLVFKILLNNDAVNIGYLIIQFLCLLVSSIIIGNFLYFTFSKTNSFFAKRTIRIIIFSFMMNIPVLIFFTKYYFQIIFLFLLIFIWYKQIKYFKSYKYYKVKL